MCLIWIASDLTICSLEVTRDCAQGLNELRTNHSAESDPRIQVTRAMRSGGGRELVLSTHQSMIDATHSRFLAAMLLTTYKPLQ